MPPRAPKKKVPTGNPQLEHGYTRVATELLAVLSKAKLTPHEWNVVMVVFAKTYGWKKKEDWISISQISAAAELEYSQCSRAVSGLARKRVLSRVFNGRRLLIGVQKKYAEWSCVRPEQDRQKCRIRVGRIAESPSAKSPTDKRYSLQKILPTKAPLPPNGLAGLDPLPNDDHRQTAPTTQTTVPVPVQLSERLTSLAFKVMKDHNLHVGNPQIGMTKVRAMVASYQEEMTFRALEWASRNASKNPISLAEIKLREGNHPWESEPAPAPAAPSDPVRAFVESTPIYQELMSNRRSTDPEYRQRCLKIGALDEVAPELKKDLETYLAMSEYDFVLAIATHTNKVPALEIPRGA